MSTITLPPQFKPRTCRLEMAVNQRVGASPFGGSEQAVDMLNDRWLLTCALPPSTSLAYGAWAEAFKEAMRGQVNNVRLWHFARPQPRGTARGTMLLSAAVAQGASVLPIDGISPSSGTLLAGDMLGVGDMLYRVAADVTASGGAASVSITGRVRSALADNAPVTWDKPTTFFRLLSGGDVDYSPRRVEIDQYQFGEYIA